MEITQPPSELSSEGPMNNNWRDWKYKFEIFLKASGKDGWPMDRKANLLLKLIGPVGQIISENLSPVEREDMDILMRKFNNHFCSTVTETRERYVFFSSVRQHTETIDQYVDILKVRTKTCNFGELSDSLIRDKIVLDLKSHKLRKHLLNKSDLTLAEAIHSWKVFEDADKLKYSRTPKIAPGTVIKPKYKVSANNLNHSKNDDAYCERCGMHHDPKHCSAWGQNCRNCGMKNHLTECCTKPSTSNIPQNKSKAPKYFNAGPFTLISSLNKTDPYK